MRSLLFISFFLIGSCYSLSPENLKDIDVKVVDKEVLNKNADEARKLGITIPTYKEMKNPNSIKSDIKEKLKKIGINESNPLNLFRITWKNEPKTFGGGFGKVNYITLPSSITGVKAKIVVLTGKWFPTGSLKVGAAISCFIPRLVTGKFDLAKHNAAWPSTGNYCRGGVFNSCILGVKSIAILPELMSKERFDWLEKMNCEVIKTLGGESSVKEIYDKCKELRKNNKDIVVFNQFEDFGNYIWHYEITGNAMSEVIEELRSLDAKYKVRGIVSSIGSAGTIASGDYLKNKYPWIKIVASESLQCPTLSKNGYGDHRIEGIGDKHVPWIYNAKNTDMIVAIDDETCLQILRLFNTSEGINLLSSKNVTKDDIENLKLFGISGIANVLAAIKFAKYYQLKEYDIIITVATDSVDMYKSRLDELQQNNGEFSAIEANIIYEKLVEENTFGVYELLYVDKKRIQNLKYYTWVEQQGKSQKELDAQWDESYWEYIQEMPAKLDKLIKNFNAIISDKKQ